MRVDEKECVCMCIYIHIATYILLSTHVYNVYIYTDMFSCKAYTVLEKSPQVSQRKNVQGFIDFIPGFVGLM